MAQLILKEVGFQNGPNLIIGAFKSRELSPSGGRRGGQKGMSDSNVRGIQYTISSFMMEGTT